MKQFWLCKSKIICQILCLLVVGCSNNNNKPTEPNRHSIPNIPDLLSAELIDSTGVKLYWRDLSNNENGFEVYGIIETRVPNLPAISTTNQFKVSENTTSVIDEILVSVSEEFIPYSTRSFKVRSFNLGGNSDWTELIDVPFQ